MKKDALTLTVIMMAQSSNYGESIGNFAQLKKMSRFDGNLYTYISRQALRYNMMNQMHCDNTPVTDKGGVVQFAPEATIKDYPEIDLFGYMKTSSKDENGKGGQSTRSAVVRLSNAVSLYPYTSDTDYLTNMGLAKRSGMSNAIAQSEIHNSLYSYTVTIDLDRVGVDKLDSETLINLEAAEKARRVKLLLDTIEFLYRDIKGRRENLAPIFIVGGNYERKNPYFEGRIELNRGLLNIELLNNVIQDSEDTKNNTVIGMLPGILKNEEKIAEKLHPVSISEAFTSLKKSVDEYYG
jgi:CRISPR-associated protein Cst2